jgi:hypothetical protein
MNKQELFRSCAGLVLGKLEEAHPDRVHLIPRQIVVELGEEESDENVRLCYLTVEWLQENGYIRCDEKRYRDARETCRSGRLTDKGFAALQVKVDFRGKSERVGAALVEQVGTVVGEARNAAIGELVGHVLGGFAKGWSGS